MQQPHEMMNSDSTDSPVAPEAGGPAAANRSGIAVVSALAGGAVWCALAVSALFGNAHFDAPRLLLLAAMLVFVPLGLDLTAAPDAAGNTPAISRLVRLVQLPAALVGAVSFFMPVGPAAGVLAGVWLGLTLLALCAGLQRIARRAVSGIANVLRLEELAVDAALLYLPIGGAWLVAERAGLQPLGFSGLTALLTAVHFHFAGFIAPLVAGMAGRRLVQVYGTAGTCVRWYRAAALGVIAGPPLVAAGISFSPVVEVVSAVVLATCVTIVGVLVAGPVARSIAERRARLLLRVSASASVLAMMLACLYAVGTYLHGDLITIPQMALTHGVLNATFALAALMAWTSVRPPSVP